MFVNQKEWEENIEGWEVTSCSILDRSNIFLCLREKISMDERSSLFDHDVPSRLVGIMLDKEEGQRCFNLEFTGLNRPIVGVSRNNRQALLAANNEDGQVWPLGNGKNGPYEHIAIGKWPSPNKLVCINGNVYSVGGFRQIFKRQESGEWIPLKGGLPKNRIESEDGFLDMDAFNDNEIYAVGGNGDVWRFDGETWFKCKFPSRERVTTVTCAPDGNVYIGGENGSLWMGKENNWQCVYKNNSYGLWNNSIWFQNQLWLISDVVLKIWDGNEMLDVQYMEQIISFSGYMDTYDDMLVIAEPESVWLYDGEKWECVFSDYN